MHNVETLFPDLEPRYLTRIYFGLAVCLTRIKIGKTGRPNGRRGGEMHFTELCSVPGGDLTEQMYHDMYAAERIGKTEWFHLSDRLLMDLYAMCVKQERRESAEILKAIILTRLREAAA
jgi:hypothetical protein